jgi:hypothetical protein
LGFPLEELGATDYLGIYALSSKDCLTKLIFLEGSLIKKVYYRLELEGSSKLETNIIYASFLLFSKSNFKTLFFTILLASLSCLNTMYILHTYQIITLLICILCGLHVETHDHMFF